jgi:methionyl-tRNA formyltransferase
MRIIVMGQQAFGKAVLEAMLARGEDVVAVYCAPDKEGRPADPLKAFALEQGLPVHQPASYKDPATLDEMRALKADLCVMAFVTQFVPEAAREIPTHGSICFHPSLLPLHRGPSSINWPIIGGATKTGLTVFYPNDGLDEGDILLQKEVEIGPDDTLGFISKRSFGLASMPCWRRSISSARARRRAVPRTTPRRPTSPGASARTRRSTGVGPWTRSTT